MKKIACVLLVLIVSGCGLVGNKPDRTNDGFVTIEGNIKALGITSWQYGSHLLVTSVFDRYALTSDEVNLQQYEDAGRVRVQGKFVDGYPVDGGPPYLRVTEIQPVSQSDDQLPYASIDYSADGLFMTSGSGSAVVGVFVKVPEPGRVKTRLGEDVGMKRAASFYAGCVAWYLERLRQREFTVVVFYAPGSEEEKLKEMYSSLSTQALVPQEGENLGQRMYHAMKYLSDHYDKNPILTGSDTPLLPMNYLRKAAESLEKYDLVLGPARDGGYYLIGSETPHKDLFYDMEWSHSGVLEKTLERANNRELSVKTLPQYNDIDTLEDLLTVEETP